MQLNAGGARSARHRTAAAVLAGLCVCPGGQALTLAQPPGTDAVPKKVPMSVRALGSFDVKLKPLAEDKTAGSNLGRMSIDKQFHGDLEGTSRGEMLTALTSIEGSAGYVAIERVSGTLKGRSGTFVLQHHGLMTRGAQQLTVTVVPDSGTGQLAGLAGTMKITIAGGQHSYDFEYTLPDGM